VSRYQKGKTNLDFTETRDSEWQWHQLGHMQVCTSFQTDNHTSTPPLCFLQAGCPSNRPTNSVKSLKDIEIEKENDNNPEFWLNHSLLMILTLWLCHIFQKTRGISNILATFSREFHVYSNQHAHASKDINTLITVITFFTL